MLEMLANMKGEMAGFQMKHPNMLMPQKPQEWVMIDQSLGSKEHHQCNRYQNHNIQEYFAFHILCNGISILSKTGETAHQWEEGSD